MIDAVTVTPLCQRMIDDMTNCCCSCGAYRQSEPQTRQQHLSRLGRKQQNCQPLARARCATGLSRSRGRVLRRGHR